MTFDHGLVLREGAVGGRLATLTLHLAGITAIGSTGTLTVNAVDPIAQPPNHATNSETILNIDRGASEYVIRDKSGAHDLFGIFHAFSTAGVETFYMLLSKDKGASWSYVTASSGTPPAQTATGARFMDSSITQDTVTGAVHHIMWKDDTNSATYSRISLTRDGNGHINAWSWVTSDIAGPSANLTGWTIGSGWHYAKLNLREVVDGNGAHILVLTLQDRPGATGSVNRILITRTVAGATALAPTGASDWRKLTDSATSGLDVIVSENSDTSTDPNAMLNISNVSATEGNQHQREATFAYLSADKSIHVFLGQFYYNDTFQNHGDVRRWRFTSSGANWVLDTGANGSVVTNAFTGVTCDIGNAVASNNYAYLIYSDTNGLHIGRVGTAGTWTGDVVTQPRSSSTHWWFSAMSVAPDDSKIWVQFEDSPGSHVMNSTYEGRGMYDGSSWSITQDGTWPWISQSYGETGAYLCAVMPDGLAAFGYNGGDWGTSTINWSGHTLYMSGSTV